MTCLIANYNTTIPLTLTLPQARGIDIPMLDNVINYNFPDKAKLFLHRVGGCGLDHVMSCDCHVIVAAGRVARAGRTGSAYSLVSTDELPYFIDLHLFISRPVILAKPVLEDDAALGMYVRVRITASTLCAVSVQFQGCMALYRSPFWTTRQNIFIDSTSRTLTWYIHVGRNKN